MKIIQVPNLSGFEIYDNQVQQGKLFNHTSSKDKPQVRQDASSRSYKVYESKINLVGRVGRYVAVSFSSLIMMPYWSKDCRRLWNEASSGKEKVKVISLEQSDDEISLEQPDEEVAVEKPDHERSFDRPDIERTNLVKLISTCVNKLLDTNEPSSSISVYLHLKKCSEFRDKKLIIDKQFLFKSNENDPLNISDINHRIQNYIEKEFLKGENLREAFSLHSDVMGISQNESRDLKYNIMGVLRKQLHFRSWDDSISHYNTGRTEEWTSGDSKVATQSHALIKAKVWFKYHLPDLKMAIENGEFVELEGIYQPV